MERRLEMPVTQRLVTAEEFEQMPDEPGVRLELVCGRVIRMSPGGVRHSTVGVRLIEVLLAHVNLTGIGRILLPAGFKLASNPDTVREPDLAFVSRERFAAVGEPRGFFPGPPDLAIEIVSPRDRLAAVRGKAHDYLERGVRMVWAVDPEDESITVYTPLTDPLVLREGSVLEGGEVMPGFRCDIRRIFH